MKKLIAVMDLGCFKVYRVTRDDLASSDHLELIDRYDPERAHSKFSDRVTDQAGRFPGNASHGSMSQGENHNSTQEIRRRLLKELTSRLTHLLHQEKCDSWYLSASKEIHPRVLEALDPALRSRLRVDIAADFTKLEGADLLARFAA